MTDLLPGRVAVVTGGASGNGRAIALAMAAQGASALVVADLQETPREGGTPTHELIRQRTGANAIFVRCDVSVPAEVASAIDRAETFGGVDVLVNNAGIFRSKDFFEVSETDYATMMDVNVKGTFFATQAAARSMARRGRGAIINIGSISALAGAASYSTYCASKGAVRLLTQALAAALGPLGIRVNMVCPGLVQTVMTTDDVPIFGTEAGDAIAGVTPLAHTGTPQDIADTVVYLASDLAQWVSGSVLVLDGGRTSTLPGGLAKGRGPKTVPACLPGPL